MDALPGAAAAAVVAHLLDERDLAALQCSCRFWRGVLADNAALWRTLLERRFGGAAAAAVPGAGEAAAGGEAAAARALRLRFAELAQLERPAPQLDRIIHLDGTHLQEVSEPGSRSAIKVHSVSWLELACRFVGVLPGRYRACWRMRLCGHFHFTGGRLVVRHLPATCPAALEAVAAGAADPLLPILQEDGVRGQLRANAAPEPREARTQLTVVTRAHLDEAFQQEGSDLFEQCSAPFEAPCISVVYAKFHSPQGSTVGMLFDSVRLERL
ncbi:hypothetical protein COHA_005932 [Chlorella ohadii]|uniref:F-box domain-containing protein n=1 Tax=Chlorella ohadii TaxID=2649997 RepID=A0AAD5DTK0_9CHLO|nr:hypothetical protein COHA_005932 [Chlorella ohadii]